MPAHPRGQEIEKAALVAPGRPYFSAVRICATQRLSAPVRSFPAMPIVATHIRTIHGPSIPATHHKSGQIRVHPRTSKPAIPSPTRHILDKPNLACTAGLRASSTLIAIPRLHQRSAPLNSRPHRTLPATPIISGQLRSRHSTSEHFLQLRSAQSIAKPFIACNTSHYKSEPSNSFSAKPFLQGQSYHRNCAPCTSRPLLTGPYHACHAPPIRSGPVPSKRRINEPSRPRQ